MADSHDHRPLDDDCSSSIFPFTAHFNTHHHFQQQLCHSHQHVHLLPYTHQFQDTGDLLAADLQSHGPSESLLRYPGIPSCRPSQQECTSRVSFWKAFNTGLFDLNHRTFGELEAVCNLAQNMETNYQTGSALALTDKNPNVSTTAATVPLVRVSDASAGEEEASRRKRRARKRNRKKEMEEELNSMAAFFEGLVKRVMDHQEGLHNKLLQMVESMDKERVEREEAQRRQEIENFNREAIARARERAEAFSRDSSIVSYIERITGQSLDLFSQKSSVSSIQPRLDKT